LLAAFGLTSANSFSITGRTLTDTGATSVFLGVSMPNSDWHDHWFDDGDGFAFGLGSGTIGMANLSGVVGPVMALGNSGRTIAAFVIDEAGNTWINNGSAVQLWENMYSQIVPEPGSMTLLAAGVLALGTLGVRRRRGSGRSVLSR
jgi:PEP-CTERM motif-containing protein